MKLENLFEIYEDLTFKAMKGIIKSVVCVLPPNTKKNVIDLHITQGLSVAKPF